MLVDEEEHIEFEEISVIHRNDLIVLLPQYSILLSTQAVGHNQI